MTRIRLTIDRITSDTRLDRAALEAALRREAVRLDGGGAESGHHPSVSTGLAGQGSLAERVARSTVKAVKP